MSAFRDGERVPTDQFEAAVWFASIRIARWRCPNVALIETAGLWWHFARRGWDDSLRGAPGHFYCRVCLRVRAVKVRPWTIEPVVDQPIMVLPLPPDRELKRRMSRFKT
jgi:hypothetical protein